MVRLEPHQTQAAQALRARAKCARVRYLRGGRHWERLWKVPKKTGALPRGEEGSPAPALEEKEGRGLQKLQNQGFRLPCKHDILRQWKTRKVCDRVSVEGTERGARHLHLAVYELPVLQELPAFLAFPAVGCGS